MHREGWQQYSSIAWECYVGRRARVVGVNKRKWKGKKVVGHPRIELGTSVLSGLRSNRLS